MIKPEYKDLLKILSCFLHQKRYSLSEECDQTELRRLATQHSISGIVGYMLRQGGDEWAQDYYATCAETVQRINAFSALERKLDEAAIDHLMLKGFVIREDYPISQLRTFGDLDIIIHPENRNRTHDLLISRGYTCEEDWEPSYSYRKGDEYYEFQTELLDKDPTDKADFRGFFSDPWEHATRVGEYRYKLDSEYCFLYVLAHLAKHVSVQGAGLRMYLDVAVLVQKNEVNWERVLELIHELKMERFFETVLSAVEDWFDVTPPIQYKKADERVLDELLVFTMEGGTFGFHGEDRSTMMLRENKGGKLGLIIRRIFPPVKTISSRYTYLQRRPWLLPVAWMHRAVLNRRRLRRERDLLRRIVSSDAEHVEQMKDMFNKIGL